MSGKIIAQYERGIVFCWGRVLPGIREPELTWVDPFVDRLRKVNMQSAGARIRPPMLDCLRSYLMLVGSAMRFGELVNSICRLHRGLLYDALGYPRPENNESERDAGIALA